MSGPGYTAPPMFVTGTVRFDLDGQPFEFSDRKISLFGLSGLDWGTLHPLKHFGLHTVAHVSAHSKDGPIPNFKFHTKGVIVREMGRDFSKMGVRFLLEAEKRREFEKWIKIHGAPPKEYARAMPRIPALSSIDTFPLRATLNKPVSAVLDIENLSPNGALLSTENQAVFQTTVNDPVEITLEPRGTLRMPIHASAVICRIQDDVNPENRNLVRKLGVQFTSMSGEDQLRYKELLKSILERLNAK